MGLDISVYKLEYLQNKNPQDIDEDDYMVLNESPELSMFSKFAFFRDNSYYELDSAIISNGYNPDDLDYYMSNSDDNNSIKITYLNKKHILYECFQFVQNVYGNTCTTSESDFFENKYVIEFKDKYLDLLKSHSYKENFSFQDSDNKTYYSLDSVFEFSYDKVCVNIIDPPLIIKKELCITYSEIGYQREGANSLFYKDDMWDSECITDLNTLKNHHIKYFSSSKEKSDDFKRNIIDKFIEGESFVIYH